MATTMAALALAAPALGAEPPSAGNPPGLELLEFLGEFEDPDGEWVDPELLLELPEVGSAEPGDDG